MVTSAETEIARLEARIEALEAALEQRSRELRIIQNLVSERDLVNISRILAGRPPLPHGDLQLEAWNETTELQPADVESTLNGLWSSIQPFDGTLR